MKKMFTRDEIDFAAPQQSKLEDFLLFKLTLTEVA